jgi:uncharacterized protein (DUF488 family)
LTGVGYQGRTVDDLAAQLAAMGVARVVDVRLNPISRKPRLSKTGLGPALAAGNTYQHRRQLGNPKTNRARFAGPDEHRKQARQHYLSLLRNPAARDAPDPVAETGRHELLAVLCFEADQSHCHRDLVLREATRRLTDTSTDGGNLPPEIAATPCQLTPHNTRRGPRPRHALTSEPGCDQTRDDLLLAAED